VLGWSNAAKLAALQTKARVLEARLAQDAQGISAVAGRAKQHHATAGHLGQAGRIPNDYRELDWQAVAQEPLTLRCLRMERRSRNSTSACGCAAGPDAAAPRRYWRRTCSKPKSSLAAEPAQRRRAKTEQKISDTQGLRRQTESLLTAPGLETPGGGVVAQVSDQRLLALQILGEHTLTIESCDNRERDMRDGLQKAIDADEGRIKRLRDKIIDAMRSFSTRYPLETQEVDVSVEAAGDYRTLLDKLAADDLPRFEARFKELLNENTIREVAHFHSQLNRERETIKERIARINQSLTQIDYNPGRYIVLEAQLATDAEVRDFQTELRACLEGSLSGSNTGNSDESQYSEAKFLQVKHIIERLRGREGQGEQDRRWTTKVTDVRNWFVFAASERWREDDREHEHYSDSGGKSGGQKEKLAYTILAASLAYQFGLAWGEKRSRSFRFVVIDEAFGRGSDESAQYGLKLFQQLNLQLLIVTPLQKIHIIEPYVSSVGFVHNEEGRDSKLRNLSIEEYRAEKSRVELAK
jgi:uncharacterized protein YPO0396